MGSLIQSEVEKARAFYDEQLPSTSRRELGQVMTPWPVASFMASLVPLPPGGTLRLLDPGAGIGSLTAAVVERAIQSPRPPRRLELLAYELDDQVMAHGLERTLSMCASEAKFAGIEVSWSVRTSDFVSDAAHDSFDSCDDFPWGKFDAVIMNPPYLKIRTTSRHRAAARALGLETTNLYTAFVAAAFAALKPKGQLVAITPRSFCNGTYFRPFRQYLLERSSLKRLHVFASRRIPSEIMPYCKKQSSPN